MGIHHYPLLVYAMTPLAALVAASLAAPLSAAATPGSTCR